jgi:nitroreductase
VEPGPGEAELRQMLEIAARTPDHGKLAPWRFVIIERAQRSEFQRLLEEAYRADNAAPGRLELESIERFAQQAPTLVVTLSSPVVPHKIPLWEQELSCGAALMNLLHAAHASGYAAGWVTGWAAFSPHVLAAFGAPPERIAGFVFIGTPGVELEERPRPEMARVASAWRPNG